ncbi:hypothetical protein R4575_17025 [Acinetobacter baumannii]|nr:hypothetical protein [Acinetobacter baumannii]
MIKFKSLKNMLTSSFFIGFVFFGLISAVFGGIVYAVEFAPAKYWSIESLAKCTMKIEDDQTAKEILNKIGETPLRGEVERSYVKCQSIVEEQNLTSAKKLLEIAKER